MFLFFQIFLFQNAMINRADKVSFLGNFSDALLITMCEFQLGYAFILYFWNLFYYFITGIYFITLLLDYILFIKTIIQCKI